MPRKKPKSSDPVTLASLGLENYEVIEINRAELKGCPYNPRIITDAEKRKLKAGLQRHGLVAPITWNRRSGFIVGGHQRLASLDSLAGTGNYSLHVAAIDVDEGREKELVVLLNNAEAQGGWDLLGLKTLFGDKSLDLAGMGFDGADLFRLFGEDPTKQDEPDQLDELAAKVRGIAAKYDEIRTKNREKNREDFYLVVVFRNAIDLDDFTAAAGLPMNRYQSGAEIRRLCGLSERSSESNPATSYSSPAAIAL